MKKGTVCRLLWMAVKYVITVDCTGKTNYHHPSKQAAASNQNY